MAARTVTDFGAVGDGITDDTQAFRNAIASTFNAWEVVYAPPGTYLVSGTIAWKRFLAIRGAGIGRTVIRLGAASPGFTDATLPKPLFFCRENGATTDNNNTSHSNYIMHLSIEIGTGNPGAVAIDYASHNGGMISDVELLAASGSGHTGISMMRDSPGPALVQRTRIQGFATGMAVGFGLYGMSFDRIHLERQRTTGIFVDSHPATIRRLTSINTVPALVMRSFGDQRWYGLSTVIDATCTGGGSGQAAIDSDGELFVRDLRTAGYGHAIRDGATKLTGPVIAEYGSTTLVGPFGVAGSSLHLPIPDAPVIPWDADASTWTKVTDFAHLRDGDNWAPAIQAAIDSGATTVVFPNQTHAPYPASGTVYLRGAVRRIIGMFARSDDLLLETRHEHPVHLEMLRNWRIRHRSSQPLVLEGCYTPIETFPGAGDCFVADWLNGQGGNHTGLHVTGSRLYGVQINDESTGPVPKLVNDGGTMVILGLKTEQGNLTLDNRRGASTEILGGMIYPAQGVTAQEMYRNRDSSLAVVHREIAASFPHFIKHDGAWIDPPFPRGVRWVSRGLATRLVSLTALPAGWDWTVVQPGSAIRSDTGTDTSIQVLASDTVIAAPAPAASN